MTSMTKATKWLGGTNVLPFPIDNIPNTDSSSSASEVAPQVDGSELDDQRVRDAVDSSATSSISYWIQAILGFALLLSGGLKLLGVESQVQNFERWRYPQWFRMMTGATEAVGGIGLLTGLLRPKLGILGGSLVSGTMLGALYTHLVRVRDPPSEAIPAGLLLTLAAFTIGRQIRSQGHGLDDGRSEDYHD